MDEKQQEDSLDRQLREAAPYIDDEGFTVRVLRKLPPPRRGRDSLRAVILLGITLLASALAYVLSDGGRFLVVAMAPLVVQGALGPRAPEWLLPVTLLWPIAIAVIALVWLSSRDKSKQ